MNTRDNNAGIAGARKRQQRTGLAGGDQSQVTVLDADGPTGGYFDNTGPAAW